MASPKRTAIFIGNVHPGSTAQNIHEVLQSVGIHKDLIEVFETKIRKNNKKAFKALVPQKDLE